MFHQQSAAARDRAASTSLLSVTVLDVLSSTPAGGSRRAPRICSPLVAPRCDRGATSGLITYWPAADSSIDGESGRGGDRAAQPAIPAPGGGAGLERRGGRGEREREGRVRRVRSWFANLLETLLFDSYYYENE